MVLRANGIRVLTAALLIAIGSQTMVAAAGGPTGSATAITLDGAHLDWPTMLRVLHENSVDVRLSESARRQMATARQGALDTVAGGQRVYGWNQALGPLKDRPLNSEEQQEFQRRVLRSHAAGTGPALPPRVARLTLVLRANTMARGTMGVRPELVDRMLSLVNAGVLPTMPEIGSLGTGDLQPMAAAGLSMIGEANPVFFEGRQTGAPMALRAAGLPERFTLEAGEALPLISGGSALTARLAEAIDRADRDIDAFIAGFALFLEATRAEQGAFDERTHAERGIPEQVDAAAQIRSLYCGTQWMTEAGRELFGQHGPRVQDATSVRSTPHVLSTLRRTLAAARDAVVGEANASTSNPLIFPRDSGGHEFVMGGNWAATHLGEHIDRLNAQLANLAVLSEGLSGRLLDPDWSYGLPANLAGGPVGLNSGMVQAETVAAALVPEIQIRANPASTLSRPVKGGQEDLNPMAMASLRNLADNLDRLDTVLGVQIMMAAQAVDLARPRMPGLAMGSGTEAVQAIVRQRIEPLTDDRYLSPDVEAATALVRDGALSRIADEADEKPCAA
ncbi:aromatic amino acid ammonia-lyase [Nocardia sp. CDC159]|uniref:Aromatic amino acid ammonia-lyase n=1 Tax=Nocardia pulmonis TaxID=2951408 RepID=A0A9X2ECF1_9NOCA|nr:MULTISPECIES: aromatic amino acid ammonia-lyase [Nocardia]MCM6775648.1 aromatic amino acid ammonia-lyase [Nocardia pulmonis]MCM6788376.1 aromatic amino acid ammonia-lyase [Nocardia sp. CDC159]